MSPWDQKAYYVAHREARLAYQRQYNQKKRAQRRLEREALKAQSANRRLKAYARDKAACGGCQTQRGHRCYVCHIPRTHEEIYGSGACRYCMSAQYYMKVYGTSKESREHERRERRREKQERQKRVRYRAKVYRAIVQSRHRAGRYRTQRHRRHAACCAGLPLAQVARFYVLDWIHWRARDILKNREEVKRWRLENKDKERRRVLKRRERLRLANGGRKYKGRTNRMEITQQDRMTPAAWEFLKKQYHGCCAYCGKKTQRLTQDHVVPLSRGGQHTFRNIVPACHDCNSHKGASVGYIPRQGRLFT